MEYTSAAAATQTHEQSLEQFPANSIRYAQIEATKPSYCEVQVRFRSSNFNLKLARRCVAGDDQVEGDMAGPGCHRGSRALQISEPGHGLPRQNLFHGRAGTGWTRAGQKGQGGHPWGGPGLGPRLSTVAGGGARFETQALGAKTLGSEFRNLNFLAEDAS